MSKGLNESRFNMWRAVFAMAHTDHVVTQEEKDFMRNYLLNVPFSDEQRDVLQDDIENPQHIEEMFDRISSPEDRGEFFQFARMLCWCDGDFHAQEEEIKTRLNDLQMKHLDMVKLEKELALTREMGEWQREKDDVAFRDTAGGIVGLGAFMRGLGSGVKNLVRK